MKKLSNFILAIILSYGSFAQTGIPVPNMSHCDNQVNSFLNQYDIPSATMAIAQDGKLVDMRAGGNAELAGTEHTQP
ncbi:MAG: hypothetical protein AAF927_30005 [Bacteroidota bacterium]